MPSRIPRIALGLSQICRLSIPPKSQPKCLFCSLCPNMHWSSTSRRLELPKHRIRPRSQSNVAPEPAANFEPLAPAPNTRIELRDSLLELQKHAGSFVNISRLQLALRGLEQPAGEETIRIAVLWLNDGGSSLRKAKELLRLLLADPLKMEEEWERILVEDHQGGKPLLLRVGSSEEEENSSTGRLVQELHVSSPVLNGSKLEILVLGTDPPLKSGEVSFTEAVLVPTMEIPTSSTGRYTQVTTPVHKSLIVSEGIMGATSLAGYPIGVNRDIVGAVADLKVGNAEERDTLPFLVVDVSQGTAALQSFRESVNNALTYEQNWFASGVQDIVEWLKAGTSSVEGSMKAPVRKLLGSIITNATFAIQAEQASKLSATLSMKVSSSDIVSLRKRLFQWAENAHTELRDELDIAFNGRRWQKLGWWKLFLRVDDVSMIAGEILNQRFLTDAEKEIVFLAGRIAQAEVLRETTTYTNWAYKPVVQEKVEARLGDKPEPPQIQALIESKDHLPIKIKLKPWPLHIPVTRAYLSQDTVPALQALAQKLVLQTFTTSFFASIFAGLMYVSTLSTGLYEAGAVAALGIVWSLRRMQGKWETARKFWEGEVREEGRKAVRSVEGVIGEVLTTQIATLKADAELERAREAIERAEVALASCK